MTGTVVSGSVPVGDELEWLPAGKPVRVRGLHRHDRPVEQVGRGSRAAINLVGVHHAEIRRGHELAAPGYLEPSRILSVEIVESADGRSQPLRHRGRYKLHLGTAEVPACCRCWIGTNRCRAGHASASSSLAEPVVAVHGQPFVLRAESPPATLGGGRVLQPSARRYRRRDRAAIERLERLRSADPLDRVRAALVVPRPHAVDRARLAALVGLPADAIQAGPGGARRLRGRWSSCRSVPGARSASWPSSRPTWRTGSCAPSAGCTPPARASRRSPASTSPPSCPTWPATPWSSGILERLKRQGRVVADARTVALPGHEARLSQGERRLKQELADAIRAGGITPPDASELAASAGTRAAVVPDLLALLRDEQQDRRDQLRALPRRRRRRRAPPQGPRTTRRRLRDHHGRAPRPAGHHPQVRRPHRRIPRPHRPDPPRGRPPPPRRLDRRASRPSIHRHDLMLSTLPH